MSLSWPRYQAHLEQVSRSFSFCIARLESPLKEWVGLSYLLCRIVDTIEDTEWQKREDQKRAFSEFDSWLSKVPSEPVTKKWLSLFKQKNLPPSEWTLLEDAHLLFEDLHLKAPAEIKCVMLHLVQSMSHGMQHFQSHHQIKTLLEVNQYCFFVAGLVGEALCKLLAQHDGVFVANESSLLKAHHFGLFLQKVNLLKDQIKDENEGRYLVPDRSALRASMLEHAEQAWSFLSSLPLRQQGFRIFCAWSLFLGLATIPVAEKAFAKKKSGKLSRLKTQLLVRKVEKLERDPEALKQLFDQCLSDSGLSENNGNHLSSSFEDTNASQDHWLTKIYSGELSKDALTRLGVLRGPVSV